MPPLLPTVPSSQGNLVIKKKELPIRLLEGVKRFLYGGWVRYLMNQIPSEAEAVEAALKPTASKRWLEQLNKETNSLSQE